MAENGVDLESFLSVLDRTQLEHLVVRMIMKDESNFDALVDATSFLDEDALLEEIENLPDGDETEDYQKLLMSLVPIVERAVKYASIDQGGNAVKVLYSITNHLIVKLIETPDFEAFPREVLNERIAEIENAWKTVISKYTPPPTPAPALDVEAKKAPAKSKKQQVVEDEDEDEEYEGALIEAPVSYEDLFKTLADWRVKLTEKMGPLFSDPLRVLKATMMKSGKTKPATAATTTATQDNKGKSKAGQELGNAKKKQKK